MPAGPGGETPVERQSDRLAPLFAEIGEWLENGDFSEPMARSLEEVDLRVAQNFADSTTATGRPWAPRKHIGDGHPLLIDTERLVASMLGPSVGLVAQGTAEGQAEHSRLIGPREAWVSSTNPYGPIHDKGTARMVARPFAHINDETADKILEIFGEVAEQKIQELIGRQR